VSGLLDEKAPALEMRGIGKRFGDVWVLQDVDLEVQQGAIHAIVGHNGAGKSTLMKIALGVYEPTQGEVLIRGTKLTYSRPAAARALGLGMVLQERSLIKTLSGLDNWFLNSELTSFLGLLRRGREAEEAGRTLDQLGISRSLLYASVAEMSTMEEELLEIAKALRLADRVLILDEPTAPLGQEEIKRVFKLMRDVASRGTGIVLITHHLAEVFAVSDQITCLREGRVVLSCPTTQTTMSDVIKAMLGRSPLAVEARGIVAVAGETTIGAPTPSQKPSLEVKNLKVGEKLLDVSFSILPGEILGVAGLAGSGRSTLLRTLFGDIRPTSGEILLKGSQYKPKSPGDAIARRTFLIPEDRGVFGLVLTKPIVENLVLPILKRFVNKFRVLQMSYGRAVAKAMMSRLDVRAQGMDQVVGELSGGNQQKIVLAKALAANAELLLLDEPTFGVDIGTTREIIRQVRGLAGHGAAVLWVTSDFRELLEVADRVVVLRDGAIEGAIRRGDRDFNEDVIIARIQRGQFLKVAQR
jgi:ribose transport system ATP-binding protein